MSALHPERAGNGDHEPDSELRDALQRVARDLERNNRHRRHDGTEGLQHDHNDDGLQQIEHRKDDSGASIHVEDILNQSALEDPPNLDITSFEASVGRIDNREDGQSARISPTPLSNPCLQRRQGGRGGVESRPSSRVAGDIRGSSQIVQTLLEAAPTIGFFKFLDDWLQDRGLKTVEGPSPVTEAWISLTADERLSHEARARYELDVHRFRGPSKAARPQRVSRAVVTTEDDRKGRQTRDTSATQRRGSSMIGIKFSDVEKRAINDVAASIVQQLDVLYQVSGTNYLLLTSPVFQPSDTFPVLSHSPPAETFWQGLRGGPGTNLAKFLALSHPAVTSRRLAIPSGARSLDVKSRLNASMRQMVREASNVADAEMKWTRPESLIQIYGVKIVGWPIGVPGAEDEMVPMRNPSNNSVAQNKLLLSRIEAGILRVVTATEEDRLSAAGISTETQDLQEPTQSRETRSARATPGVHAANGDGPRTQMVPLYEHASALEVPGPMSRSEEGSSKRERVTRARGLAPGTKLKYRSKSLLTLNPDGTIRPGGLEGKRRLGRPRKEVPITSEDLPHLSNNFEYHANQRRIAEEQAPSPGSQKEEEEDTEEHSAGTPDIYIETGGLGEPNPAVVMAMAGPSLGPPAESSAGAYPEEPSVHDGLSPHDDQVAGRSHSDQLRSPLAQALPHIDYYQVRGPNFGNHPAHDPGIPRPHALTNIAPHFPMSAPGDDHNESHRSSNQEDQQYISGYTARMSIISPYTGHFPDTTDQTGDGRGSWHGQRNPGDPSVNSVNVEAEGNQTAPHPAHHTQIEDNLDIVDGIDMDAAFGNPHIMTGDLNDRGEVMDLSEIQIRSFLVGPPPLQAQNEGVYFGNTSRKRKMDEVVDREEHDVELEGILEKSRAD